MSAFGNELTCVFHKVLNSSRINLRSTVSYGLAYCVHTFSIDYNMSKVSYFVKIFIILCHSNASLCFVKYRNVLIDNEHEFQKVLS